MDWLKRARDEKMTQREAAERMGVSERWVRKLLQRLSIGTFYFGATLHIFWSCRSRSL
jgi:transcriptional regulator with XRE-family HTH domain